MKKHYNLTGTILFFLLNLNSVNAQNSSTQIEFIEKVKQDFIKIAETQPDQNHSLPHFSLKSTATYHKLDSIVRYKADTNGALLYAVKETFFYSDDSICNLRIDYTWDENSRHWINHKKYEETLSELKDTTFLTDYNWDTETADWIPYSKMTTTGSTDFGVHYTQDYFIYMSAFGQWMHFATGEQKWTENENGFLKTTSLWMLDNSTMQLTKFMRAETLYNASKQEIYSIFYTGETGIDEWQPGEKYIFTRICPSGLLEKETKQKWSTSNNDWQNLLQTEYFYDEKQNTIAELNYEWQTETTTWRVTTKAENYYDQENNYLGTTYFNRDTINDEWINATRMEIITEDNFENYDLVYSSWDTLAQLWQYTTKTLNEKQIQVAQQFLIMPERWYKLSYLWAIANQSIYDWNADLNDWELTEKSEVFYSEFNTINTGIEEGVLTNILVFPNPVHSTIYVKGQFDISRSELLLFDINGRKIKHEKAKSEIIVENLDSGIYLFQLVEKGIIIIAQKIIIN